MEQVTERKIGKRSGQKCFLGTLVGGNLSTKKASVAFVVWFRSEVHKVPPLFLIGSGSTTSEVKIGRSSCKGAVGCLRAGGDGADG
mmetsp:Transcript_1615/g.2517  ORF Transcript_1615/g.2517 Transcript_1615/m.2517 type:complete len:86 (-) Transcript_1615:327-584(-)